MSTVDARPLLTTAEVAEVLRLKPRTVCNLIHRNELPALRIAGQWRVDPDDLEAQLRRAPHRWERK